MEFSTITMDRNEARKAFLEYRRAVRERHDAEDAQIMRGYRELSRGRQLLRLSDTIAAGGMERGVRMNPGGRGQPMLRTLPRLAIARADAPVCWTTGVHEDGSVGFYTKQDPAYNNRRDVIVLGAGTFPPVEEDKRRTTDPRWWLRVRALMPKIPPPLRPRDKLGNYHVLWEAEWALEEPPAPRDPALLKHIGGDLDAVVAIWDLTEVERAVLAGRTVE